MGVQSCLKSWYTIVFFFIYCPGRSQTFYCFVRSSNVPPFILCPKCRHCSASNRATTGRNAIIIRPLDPQINMKLRVAICSRLFIYASHKTQKNDKGSLVDSFTMQNLIHKIWAPILVSMHLLNMRHGDYLYSILSDKWKLMAYGVFLTPQKSKFSWPNGRDLWQKVLDSKWNCGIECENAVYWVRMQKMKDNEGRENAERQNRGQTTDIASDCARGTYFESRITRV